MVEMPLLEKSPRDVFALSVPCFGDQCAGICSGVTLAGCHQSPSLSLPSITGQDTENRMNLSMGLSNFVKGICPVL